MYKYKQWLGEIRKVEIKRESEHSVWLKGGRREKKRTNYQNYFDTWEEAMDHIIGAAFKKVCHYQYLLQKAEVELEKAHALEENE